MAQDDLWSTDKGIAPSKPRAGVKPAEAAPSAPPPDDLWNMGKSTAPSVSTTEDVGRSVLAKGVRGAAALPGMFGDIPSLFGVEKYRPPTTEEYVEKLSGIGPGVKAALEYQPQTAAGRYAGSVAEFAPGMFIPGGQMRVGARLLSSIGAGVGSQGVEDVIRESGSPLAGTPYEAVGKVAGAVAGGLAAPSAAGKVANVFKFPETVAANRLAQARAEDIARRSAQATPEQALAEGIAPIAAGGERTQALVKGAGARASEPAVGAYREAIGKLAGDATAKVDDTLQGIFSKIPQPFEEMDTISRRIREVNDANYSRVMALPEAQRIQSPELGKVAARISAYDKDVFDDVMKSLGRQGTDPKELGLMATPYGHKIPPDGASLRFWDEVKQGLDDKIDALFDPLTKAPKPGTSQQVSDLMKMKNDLVRVLDGAVEQYPKIRFEGKELYGARDAVDAGRKFYADVSDKNLHFRRKAIAKLTDAQKEDFALGYAGALRSDMAKDPASFFRRFSGGKSGFNMNKMREALGDQNAHQLFGSINAGLLNSSIRDVAAGGRGLGALGNAGVGAGGGFLAATLGEAVMTGGDILKNLLAFNISLPTFLAAVGGAGARGLYTFRERKIADQILRLAADPAQEARLGELIAKNADARSFMGKSLELLGRTAPAVSATTEAGAPGVNEITVNPRPQRASGGRTASNIAESLMRAAEKAKRELGKETETLLNAPDEHIAKALDIAKRHI